MTNSAPRLRCTAPEVLESALRGEGLTLDYGACRARIQTRSIATLGPALRDVYGAFAFQPRQNFADYHVILSRGSGIRRVLKPTVNFQIDGIKPFEPFPTSHALPLYEWGLNWAFGQRANQFVLLHAATLDLDGRAVIMAAVPGSGKSTLAAALMLSGLRLLSDEFGVLVPETGELTAMLKPVALKNQSIAVIRSFSSRARIGRTFEQTRKGDVAHLAPDENSVARLHAGSTPALVLFPSYRGAGATLSLKRQAPEQTFARLAFNSFNYGLLGPIAFHAVADVAERCPAYELGYGNLEEATRTVRDLLAGDGTA